jgi:hypothetical protein
LAQYLVHCQIVMSMIMHGMGRNVLTSWATLSFEDGLELR